MDRVLLTEQCEQLRNLQRRRERRLKTKIKIENNLAANLATIMGYHAAMDEESRKKAFAKAMALVADIRKGRVDLDGDDEMAECVSLTNACRLTMDDLDTHIAGIETVMVGVVRQLPIHSWLTEPEQNGFGEISCGKIVGECGDLFGYENPGKVWRRMGLAPKEFNGVMQMGSTWRIAKWSQGGALPASEWEEFGYCKRRRAVAYVIGDVLIKQNFTGKKPNRIPGPYRRRYDEARERAKRHHPDWTKMHSHRHGNLLCVKRAVKHLWQNWTGEFAEWSGEEDSWNH
jgi:hypothetical protein